MKESVYFPFYSSDWISGTAKLSAVERGVYITLLAEIYEAEGPIPDKPERLARLCGCTKSTLVKALSALIDEGKIHRCEGGLMNSRAQKEIEKRRGLQKKASHSASQRWKKEREKSQQKQQIGDATASTEHMLNTCLPEPEPEEEDTGVSSSPHSPPLGDVAVEPDPPPPRFSAFWDLWPNKTARKKAEAAWSRLSRSDRHAALTAVQNGWFDRWRASRPEAAAIHATTFLNQHRWADEFPATVTPLPTGGHRERDHRQERADRRFADAAGQYASLAARAAQASRGDGG